MKQWRESAISQVSVCVVLSVACFVVVCLLAWLFVWSFCVGCRSFVCLFFFFFCKFFKYIFVLFVCFFFSGIEYMKKHEPKFDFPLACKTPMSPFISRNTERRMIHKGVPGRGKGLPEDIRSDLKKQIFDALQNHSSFPIQRYYSSNKE